MILVLRPEPGAGETVQRLRKLGLESIAAPLFVVEPVAWQPPDAAKFDALLVTSASAIRHGGDGLRQLRVLPVHAVGDATAAAARDAGFDIASSGDGGVDRLLGSIDQQLRLLHLCGLDRREPLEARQQITAIPVYRAKAVRQPDLATAKARVALVHSPRAAQRFADLIPVPNRGSIVIAAISDAAAQAAGEGWKAIEAAAEPAEEALLALAARLWQKSAAT
jgi:uroporphyrinogen-III synthase